MSSTARSSPSTSGAPVGLPATPGTHASAEGAGRRTRRTGAAGRVRRLRHPRDGKEDLTRLPLTERRKRLATHFFAGSSALQGGRKGDSTQRAGRGDATALHARALKERWEGLIAKEASSPYQPGRRSPAWRKMKLQAGAGVRGRRLDRAAADATALRCVAARRHDKRRPIYVGHTGTGFDQKELPRVSKLLKARETKTSPFSRIDQDERAGALGPPRARGADPIHRVDRRRQAAASGLSRLAGRQVRPGRRGKASGRTRSNGSVEQLRSLESARKDGLVTLPDGDTVKVTNLAKLFWPALKITKGDLLRYYVEVAPMILPCVADRPMVMKRFPNGVTGEAFYQQVARCRSVGRASSSAAH